MSIKVRLWLYSEKQHHFRELLDVLYNVSLKYTGEMRVCYIKSYAGLATDSTSQSADYMQGWLSVFRGDKKIFIQAASRAQKAAL